MKIRTDFVTNSSSSSFVVEITITDKSEREFNVSIAPDDGGGNGSANLNCDAKKILSSKSVDDVMHLLSGALVIGDEDEDEGAEYYQNQFNEFVESVKQNISDISDIDTIVLKRIWSAWGEPASCFGWNLDAYAEELPKLAADVCSSDGDAKVEAIAKLNKYLDTCNVSLEGGWSDYWPTNFCKTKPVAKITYDQLTPDAAAFAEMVTNEELPNNDYAEEIVKIDFANKKIDASAEYILKGESDGEEDW